MASIGAVSGGEEFQPNENQAEKLGDFLSREVSVTRPESRSETEQATHEQCLKAFMHFDEIQGESAFGIRAGGSPGNFEVIDYRDDQVVQIDGKKLLSDLDSECFDVFAGGQHLHRNFTTMLNNISRDLGKGSLQQFSRSEIIGVLSQAKERHETKTAESQAKIFDSLSRQTGVPLPDAIKDLDKEAKASYCKENPGVLKDWISSNESLRSITNLNLSNLGLSSIPEDLLSSFPNLENLNLSRNYAITQLPQDFASGMQSLKSIDLSYNHVQILPDQFATNCPQLTNVSLQNNHLVRVSNNIGQGCPNLRIMDFTSNRLKELPAGFGKNLGTLTHLSFSRNMLLRLPVDFGNSLSNLKVLNLGGNYLKSLPTPFLHHSPVLEFLDIRENKLSNEAIEKLKANTSEDVEVKS